MSVALLFLSYIKPSKPVTPQRVAHWIKEILDLTGVATSEFSAHLVRGASTTAALKKSVDDIFFTGSTLE